MIRRATNSLIFSLLLAGACQAQEVMSGASPDRGSTRLAEYLTEGEYPDNATLLPPPPAPGSTALALDEALNRQALALRDTARWELAAQDAISVAGGMFSCALGIPVSEKDTPNLSVLLRRSAADAGVAVTPAKRLYQRKRPFLVNEQPICVPGRAASSARNGSYPSGHAATGWVWALILAEIAPDRIDAVLARGWEFGQSRAVCNVHWQSDVIYGRVAGATLVARLHANTEFRADLENAREEIAVVRAKGLLPSRDCEAEAQALAGDAIPPRTTPKFAVD